MRKRIFAILLAAAMTASLAACGSSSKEETTTAAAETVEAEESESASQTEGSAEDVVTGGMVTEDGEYIEEAFVDGIVTRMDGDVVTVQSSADGSTIDFNIASAEVTEADRANLMEGAYVETSYLADPSASQPYASTYMIVLMNLEEEADAEGVNPTFCGTLTFIDINDAVVRAANGMEVTFDNSMSRQVSFSEVSQGSQVRVTYMGSIYEENQISNDDGSGSGTPVAIKIVTEDAASSEEAAANYLTGPVSNVTESSITVDTSYDSFTFDVDPAQLAGIEQNDNATVYYEGALTNERNVQATSVVKN